DKIMLVQDQDADPRPTPASRRATPSRKRPSPPPRSASNPGAGAPARASAMIALWRMAVLIRTRSRREPMARGSSGPRKSKISGVRILADTSRRPVKHHGLGHQAGP